MTRTELNHLVSISYRVCSRLGPRMLANQVRMHTDINARQVDGDHRPGWYDLLASSP